MCIKLHNHDSVSTKIHTLGLGPVCPSAAWPAVLSNARRIERVLWNDPASGVMRHADAGYEIALDCAREHGLDLPAILPRGS